MNENLIVISHENKAIGQRTKRQHTQATTSAHLSYEGQQMRHLDELLGNVKGNGGNLTSLPELSYQLSNQKKNSQVKMLMRT